MSVVENASNRMFFGGRGKTALHSTNAGERFKYYRLQNSLSQAQLAEGICSVATISHFEVGRSGIGVHTLEKLCDRLRVPLHEVYRPNDDKNDFSVKTKLDLLEAFLRRMELEPAKEMIEHLKSRGNLLTVELQDLDFFQADYFVKSGKPERAIQFLQPLIDNFETKQSIDDVTMCKYLNLLGTAYFWAQDFTKSYSVYKRGYQISLRFPALDNLAANITYNLGLVCNELGLSTEAAIRLDLANEYYSSNDDLKRMADSFFALTIASGDEKYLHKALVLYEGLDLLKMVQITRQYKIFHIDSKQNYHKAVDELKSVADEFVKLGEIERSVYTLARTVILCVNHGDLKSASETLIFADEFKSSIGDNGRYIPYYYLAKAKFEFSNKSYDNCLYNAYRAGELYDKMGMKVNRAEALEVAILALRETGKTDEALDLALEVNEFLRDPRRI